MRILSMTATFGKLEGQTLTLEPGLNVISAPNEWGKSTWCAFIVAMLYGIETSQRTSSKGIADKERYAPWSGKPMSGRMDILWNERRITLERSTKGRSIFGAFRAYETESGLDVPELTADNCAQVLLGVEKSVFTRSAFLRFSDLPVTQDDALRRRLNALVTTGDESGSSDKLAARLKELKNQCRHNKTGLLPQAQAQQAQLQSKLEQLQQLQARATQLQAQSKELDEQLAQLENHKIALVYAASRADVQRVEQAKAAATTAAAQAKALQTQCQTLPTAEEAQATLQKLASVQEQLITLQHRQLPPLPEPPAEKVPFQGLDAEQTQAMLTRDLQQYAALKNTKQYVPYILIAILGLLLTLVLSFAVPQTRSYAYLPVLLGLVPLLIKAIPHKLDHKLAFALQSKYGTADCSLWQVMAQSHIEALQLHREATARYHEARNSYRQEQDTLQQQVLALTQGAPISSAQKYWEQVLRSHRDLELARKEQQQTAAHAKTLAAVVRDVPPPAFTDTLTLSEQETGRALTAVRDARHRLHNLLGQAIGQMEPLGTQEQLFAELEAVNQRIEKLQRYEAALALAQDTLTTAANELQRQFAPRIAQRATALFQALTGGRYDRLTLAEDLSLSVGARDEVETHGSQWRSDGTVDQLYLALRLSVAAELTPGAPLILDDALVRFDGARLESAMQLLKAEAQNKQVMIFTCHDREKAYAL